jgi:chromosomal replication initiator protein
MVAVQQILASPAQFSPYIVYGGSGSGKSHLLEALTLELRRKWKFGSCIYLTAEQFTSHFLQSLRGDGLPVFRRKYRDVDVLAIDDIQFFANKRATISEFQYTLDHLVRAGKQILLSSDRSPLELFELGSEIVNRVNAGLVCPLQFAESDSRHRIARRFCRERNLDWPDELLAVLAERVGKDGRRISGLINQLCAASFVRQRAVDMEMLDEILPEQSPMMRRSTIQAVERALCELFGVSVQEIRSPNRSRKVSMARTLAMFFCRRHTECALSEIGDHFGGRSHSTVIAAIHRVDQMIEAKDEIPLMMGSCPVDTLMTNVENKLNCH